MKKKKLEILKLTYARRGFFGTIAVLTIGAIAGMFYGVSWIFEKIGDFFINAGRL
jgi:hypothetical protein